MNANIKMQAGVIVAAAMLIAAVGGWMLSRMMQDMEANQAAFEDMRSERWKALMRDLQSELKHTSPAKRESVFRKRLDEEPYAQGGFIWAKGKGLTFSINMPPDLASEFPTNYIWEVNGKTGALAPRALQSFGTERRLVAWQRIPKNQVVGVIVDNPERLPFDDPSMLYWVAGAFGAFTLLLAAIGVGQLMHSAHVAQQEALRKTNFVSLVSHELNTPLTAIIPYADMLRKGRLASEDERREAYEVIADESVRLKALVAELLDFSRLERKTKKYSISEFDAGALARSVAQLMRGRFAEAALDVRADGEFMARADEDAVKAILINLLDNAAKYAPGSPVEVEVERGGCGVCVAVKDRGPGLSPEGLRKVFERFWRADETATASVSGFGLGLTIARMYARDMGGDLTAAQRPDGGTVFTLELKECEDGRHTGC